MERMTVEQALQELDARVQALPPLASKECEAALATLRAELDGLREDAGRYRWLRSISVGPATIDRVLFETVSDDCNPPYRSFKHTGNLDAAIDAARQEKGHE